MTSHRIGTPEHQQPTAPKTAEQAGGSGHSQASTFERSGPTRSQKILAADAKIARKIATHDDAASARGQDADQTVAEKLAEQKKTREARKKANKELFAKLPDEIKKALGKHPDVTNKAEMEEASKKMLELLGERQKQKEPKNPDHEKPLVAYLNGLEQEKFAWREATDFRATLPEAESRMFGGAFTKLTGKTAQELLLEAAQASLAKIGSEYHDATTEDKIKLLENYIGAIKPEFDRIVAKQREAWRQNSSLSKSETKFIEAIQEQINSANHVIALLKDATYSTKSPEDVLKNANLSEFFNTQPKNEIPSNPEKQPKATSGTGAKTKTERTKDLESVKNDYKEILKHIEAETAAGVDIAHVFDNCSAELLKILHQTLSESIRAGVGLGILPASQHVEPAQLACKSLENAFYRLFPKEAHAWFLGKLQEAQYPEAMKKAIADEKAKKEKEDEAKRIAAEEKKRAEEEKAKIEQQRLFQDMPFVTQALDAGKNDWNSTVPVLDRLQNGELRGQDTTKNLTDAREIALGKLLGNAVEQDLRKFNADRDDLSSALEVLKRSQQRLAEVLEGIESLHTAEGDETLNGKTTDNQETKQEKTAALSKHRDIIEKRQAEVEKQIQQLTRGLNLVERMKRVYVIRKLTLERKTAQEKIKNRKNFLDFIAQNSETDGYIKAPKTTSGTFAGTGENFEYPKTLDAARKLRDRLGSEETGEIGELTSYAKKLDQQFEQELLRLQAQDSDTLGKGLYPIDNWTPWGVDLLRDATGIEFNRRLGTTRIRSLMIDKLWADQGVGLQEAYKELGDKILDIAKKSLEDPKAFSEEIKGLFALPSWIYENPELVRSVVMDIQQVIFSLSQQKTNTDLSNLCGSIYSVISAEGWVQDTLLGNREVPNKSVPPAGLALLHLASVAPVMIGAAQHGESWLGNAISIIPGGQWLGDAFTGAAKSAVAKLASRAIVDAAPGIGKVTTGLAELMAGGNIEAVGKKLVARSAIAETVGLVRDVQEFGLKKAIQEIGSNFKSWWNRSKPGEKIWRFLSQAAPIVGGITLGALAIAGVATGVGIPIIAGMIVGGIVMRYVNEFGINRSTTQLVDQDRAQRRREERLLSDADYLKNLTETKKPQMLQPVKNPEKATPTAAAATKPQQPEKKAPEAKPAAATTTAKTSTQTAQVAIARHINARFDELEEALKKNENLKIVVPGFKYQPDKYDDENGEAWKKLVSSAGTVEAARKIRDFYKSGHAKLKTSDYAHELGTGLAVTQWDDANANQATVKLITERLERLLSNTEYANRIHFGFVGQNQQYPADENCYQLWGANAGNWDKQGAEITGDGQAEHMKKIQKGGFGIVTTPLAGIEGILASDQKPTK